jgi:hypothetical protein
MGYTLTGLGCSSKGDIFLQRSKNEKLNVEEDKIYV